MKQYEHGGLVYDKNGQLINYQDMSANINALGLPPLVRKAIHQSIENVIHYPDVNATALKLSIARRYNVSVENILTLNGAAEFFYLYFQVMKPKRVLIISPTFSEYERAATAAGCEVKHFITLEEDNFNINFKNLKAELTDEDCVVLCRPNNPTGVMTRLNDVMRILKYAGSLIVDESFIDFVQYARSMRQQVSDNLTVVQSLTKIYAIPGLRLGFAICSEAAVKRLEQAKDVWNVNVLAQAAGIAALTDTEYIKRTHDWLKTETAYVTEQLKRLNIKYYEPAANFVLMKFTDGETVERIINALLRKKIIVRKCENFVGLDGSFIRIAIKTHTENELAMKVIANSLEV